MECGDAAKMPLAGEYRKKRLAHLTKLLTNRQAQSIKKRILCGPRVKQMDRSSVTDRSFKKVFVCELCLKTFSRSTDLKLHKLRCADEKLFVCEICRNGFGRAAELFEHKRTHSAINVPTAMDVVRGEVLEPAAAPEVSDTPCQGIEEAHYVKHKVFTGALETVVGSYSDFSERKRAPFEKPLSPCDISRSNSVHSKHPVVFTVLQSSFSVESGDLQDKDSLSTSKPCPWSDIRRSPSHQNRTVCELGDNLIAYEPVLVVDTKAGTMETSHGHSDRDLSSSNPRDNTIAFWKIPEGQCIVGEHVNEKIGRFSSEKHPNYSDVNSSKLKQFDVSPAVCQLASRAASDDSRLANKRDYRPVKKRRASSGIDFSSSTSSNAKHSKFEDGRVRPGIPGLVAIDEGCSVEKLSRNSEVVVCKTAPADQEIVWVFPENSSSKTAGVGKQRKPHAVDKPFQCEVCQKAFDNRTHLNIHRLRHSDDKPFVCDICQKGYVRACELVEHKRKHTGERPFVCDICNAGFFRASNLARHKRDHSGEKSFVCDLCTKGFNVLSSFLAHKRTHSKERPFACDLCHKAYMHPSNLKEHKKCHLGIKSFVCDVCQKCFMRSSDLADHKRSHSAEKPFVCEVCKKAFVHRSNLFVHRRSHLEEKPFVCEFCQKGYVRACDLVEHKRVHSGERPFVCDICNAGFARASTLARHKRDHSGEKPFLCDICTKRFRLLSNFLAHKRTHLKERPFACDMCKKAYAHPANLKQHKKCHLGKSFVCDVCQKKFDRACDLVGHKRIHSNEKPFVCELCDKAFVHRSNLTLHRRTHLDKKPFVCEICQKGYLRACDLVAHKRSHSGEKPFVCQICDVGFSRSHHLNRHKLIHSREMNFSDA